MPRALKEYHRRARQSPNYQLTLERHRARMLEKELRELKAQKENKMEEEKDSLIDLVQELSFRLGTAVSLVFESQKAGNQIGKLQEAMDLLEGEIERLQLVEQSENAPMAGTY